MNNDAEIEELFREVRRLQRWLTWVTVVLVILVILFAIMELPAMIVALIFHPLGRVLVITTLGFVVFLIVILLIDRHWGLGKSE